MKIMNLALAAAFLAGASMAFAAEKTIGQKGKQFSERNVTIKKGDTLVFVNDDNIAHNVMSRTAGNTFNLGSQMPGKSTPVTFDKAGDIEVICAIHPGMKMAVKVTD